jgi:hypothetical protein
MDQWKNFEPFLEPLRRVLAIGNNELK